MNLITISIDNSHNMASLKFIHTSADKSRKEVLTPKKIKKVHFWPHVEIEERETPLDACINNDCNQSSQFGFDSDHLIAVTSNFIIYGCSRAFIQCSVIRLLVTSVHTSYLTALYTAIFGCEN
ncbi:hypothetical protein P5673_025164 [Acropora cervicornis]|uniref:Uncharacterized protein n=1 Tax=Acropora cervicornis TaxID=6130 RepID=A0AAD9Q2Z7_ACRCE|nr:hypothetical protein P5673_025164 [Acropora cervicornis]